MEPTPRPKKNKKKDAASSGANNAGMKKPRVSQACEPCFEGKRACDCHRPCDRCSRLGIADRCVDHLPKKRGPKCYKMESNSAASSSSSSVVAGPSSAAAINPDPQFVSMEVATRFPRPVEVIKPWKVVVQLQHQCVGGHFRNSLDELNNFIALAPPNTSQLLRTRAQELLHMMDSSPPLSHSLFNHVKLAFMNALDEALENGMTRSPLPTLRTRGRRWYGNMALCEMFGVPPIIMHQMVSTTRIPLYMEPIDLIMSSQQMLQRLSERSVFCCFCGRFACCRSGKFSFFSAAQLTAIEYDSEGNFLGQTMFFIPCPPDRKISVKDATNLLHELAEQSAPSDQFCAENERLGLDIDYFIEGTRKLWLNTAATGEREQLYNNNSNSGNMLSTNFSSNSSDSGANSSGSQQQQQQQQQQHALSQHLQRHHHRHQTYPDNHIDLSSADGSGDDSGSTENDRMKTAMFVAMHQNQPTSAAAASSSSGGGASAAPSSSNMAMNMGVFPLPIQPIPQQIPGFPLPTMPFIHPQT